MNLILVLIDLIFYFSGGKRVLLEKPLANKIEVASAIKEKKDKLSQRRLSGRALKKLKLKQEMAKKGVTDSRTLLKSSGLKKKLENVSKLEVTKGKPKMAAKIVSKSAASKVKKEKPAIKQPIKTPGSIRKVEKFKVSKKGVVLAKK